LLTTIDFAICPLQICTIDTELEFQGMYKVSRLCRIIECMYVCICRRHTAIERSCSESTLLLEGFVLVATLSPAMITSKSLDSMRPPRSVDLWMTKKARVYVCLYLSSSHSNRTQLLGINSCYRKVLFSRYGTLSPAMITSKILDPIPSSRSVDLWMAKKAKSLL